MGKSQHLILGIPGIAAHSRSLRDLCSGSKVTGCRSCADDHATSPHRHARSQPVRALSAIHFPYVAGCSQVRLKLLVYHGKNPARGQSPAPADPSLCCERPTTWHVGRGLACVLTFGYVGSGFHLSTYIPICGYGWLVQVFEAREHHVVSCEACKWARNLQEPCRQGQAIYIGNGTCVPHTFRVSRLRAND